MRNTMRAIVGRLTDRDVILYFYEVHAGHDVDLVTATLTRDAFVEECGEDAKLHGIYEVKFGDGISMSIKPLIVTPIEQAEAVREMERIMKIEG